MCVFSAVVGRWCSHHPSGIPPRGRSRTGPCCRCAINMCTPGYLIDLIHSQGFKFYPYVDTQFCNARSSHCLELCYISFVCLCTCVCICVYTHTHKWYIYVFLQPIWHLQLNMSKLNSLTYHLKLHNPQSSLSQVLTPPFQLLRAKSESPCFLSHHSQYVRKSSSLCLQNTYRFISLLTIYTDTTLVQATIIFLKNSFIEILSTYYTIHSFIV